MDDDGGNGFPNVLWILPIFFGFIGGAIAAIIAGTVYHDNGGGWGLFVVGFLVQALVIGIAVMAMINFGINLFQNL